MENNSTAIDSNSAYEPLSFESYKFFIKFSPYIEKLLVNNINKNHIQNNVVDLKSFAKLDSDFIIRKELIDYLNVNNYSDYKIKFTSKILILILIKINVFPYN